MLGWGVLAVWFAISYLLRFYRICHAISIIFTQIVPLVTLVC